MPTRETLGTDPLPLGVVSWLIIGHLLCLILVLSLPKGLAQTNMISNFRDAICIEFHKKLTVSDFRTDVLLVIGFCTETRPLYDIISNLSTQDIICHCRSIYREGTCQEKNK